jgi:urease accessory protein
MDDGGRGVPPQAAVPRELAAFADEPPQMRSGAVGKAGHLALGFARRGERTILADLAARAPYLAQRALHFDDALPDMAWTFVITTTGCVLQGDRMQLDITLGEGARAHVTTQSATKIHAMDANHASQRQTLTLAADAYLEYLPEPLIPHRNARFASDTAIVLHPTASLLCGEILQPGRMHHRHDEWFGASALSLATRCARPDGTLLFAERLAVEPARTPVRRAGAMDRFDVLGNVFLCTPPAIAERVYAQLDATVDYGAGVAHGACRLPNDAGLVYKVLARSTAEVRDRVRAFWSIARREITGADIPAPFFWR